MEEELRLDADSLGPIGQRFVKFAESRIKGQPMAVRRLAKALDHAASPLRVKNRPIYSVLLIGGAGSGKTQLVRVLAEFWFNDPEGMTTINCSQFFGHTFRKSAMEQADLNAQQRHADHAEAFARYGKLFDERKELEHKIQDLPDLRHCKDKKKSDGVSAEKKRLEKMLVAKFKEEAQAHAHLEPILENLRSIVVFDHIEDGKTEVQEGIKEILEKGFLVLHGEKGPVRFSFANSIIFVTCHDSVPFDNATDGSRPKLGFLPGHDQQPAAAGENPKQYLRGMDGVKKYFSEPFTSCFDRIEVLKPYTHESLLGIVNLALEEFTEWLAKHFPVVLMIDEGVKRFIVSEGSDHPELGIRLLKKKFDKYIRWKLELLQQKGLVKENDALRLELHLKGGKETVVFTKVAIPRVPSQ